MTINLSKQSVVAIGEPVRRPCRVPAWRWVAAVLVLCVLVPRLLAQGEVIGDQAGTERYALANGLEVVVMSTSEYARPDDADAVQLWLVVRAGSMYEANAQRGAAEVAQRILLSGTEDLDREQIAGMLGEQAPGYASRAPALVTFDESLLMASADPDAPGELERVLSFYAQVLDPSRWALDDERFEAARSALVEQIGSMASPDLRARQHWLPELMAGTLFGQRLPIPDAQQAHALTRDRVEAFARAHYAPGSAMLLVVGDVDPRMIRDRIGAVLGAVRAGDQVASGVVDGRMGTDLAMRTVLGLDPEFEGEQAAMVWFTDRDDASVRPWSERGASYDESDMRALIIDRVAGEVVRHRLNRLSAGTLGSVRELGVEQIDLWGQVGLMQIGVEIDPGPGRGWEQAMGFLVRQCDRLSRDGAGSEELRRARRSVLTRWHREADSWRTLGDRSRASMAHWMVTTGRPLLDMVRWDERATRLMSTISENEIQTRLREIIDPRRAAYIALRKGDDSPAELQTGAESVRGVVDEALSSALDPIEDDWMARLSGPLLETQPRAGEVVEITQHAPSGALFAELSSGVRVWARSMDDGGGRVHLSATVWGDGIASGEIDQRRLEAALLAWSHPASESRSGRSVAVYMQEHGIEISTRMEINGAQLRLSAPVGEFGAAMELLYVLLDEPMIEPEVFEGWTQEGRDQGRDPLDEAMNQLYRPLRAGDPGMLTLDDAQRGLTQIVRNGQIDVGIAGPVDQQGAIEDAARLLGALAHRDTNKAEPVATTLTGNTLRERVVTIRSASQEEQGIARGYVGASADDLARMRAVILASMVLNDRFDAVREAQGFAGRLGAQVVVSDAIPGRWALMLRARCEPGLNEQADELLDAVLGEIEHSGIGADELSQVQERLERSIARYFDKSSYWSARMSTLGLQGRGIDELWTIREGYESVTPQQASDALRAALGSSDRFRVEIIDTER